MSNMQNKTFLNAFAFIKLHDSVLGNDLMSTTVWYTQPHSSCLECWDSWKARPDMRGTVQNRVDLICKIEVISALSQNKPILKSLCRRTECLVKIDSIEVGICISQNMCTQHHAAPHPHTSAPTWSDPPSVFSHPVILSSQGSLELWVTMTTAPGGRVQVLIHVLAWDGQESICSGCLVLGLLEHANSSQKDPGDNAPIGLKQEPNPEPSCCEATVSGPDTKVLRWLCINNNVY